MTQTSAQLIRAARLGKQLSQQHLADLAGLDGSAVSLLESGRRFGKPETLKKLDDVLGLPSYVYALAGLELAAVKLKTDVDALLTAAQQARTSAGDIAHVNGLPVRFTRTAGCEHCRAEAE